MDKISLDEFCKDLSTRDKRVELLAAFHYWMAKERKITKATQAEFSALFAAFTKMPA